VTEEGYAAMTHSIRGVSDSLGIRVGCVLEGGYALDALARSVAATLEALRDPLPMPAPVPDGDGVSSLVGQARERLAQWWPALA
jgi:acetoin utilization deacetylase AcuC-like enzyme